MNSRQHAKLSPRNKKWRHDIDRKPIDRYQAFRGSCDRMLGLLSCKTTWKIGAINHATREPRHLFHHHCVDRRQRVFCFWNRFADEKRRIASHTREITPRGSLADIRENDHLHFQRGRTVGGVHLHRKRGGRILRDASRFVRGLAPAFSGTRLDMW
jgi:hypothetical protein